MKVKKIQENVGIRRAFDLDQMPPEVISALAVLSCFGSRSDVSLMEVLENEIHQPLISPLNEAVANSVLGKRNGEFYFTHDKLQEAAYNMMTPEERSLQHNRCGLALGFVAARDKNDRMLLTAVGQINLGGPQAVIDGEQAMVVATLNLDAGKKALKMSDFFSAYSFFNHGISYLQRDHWNETYNLSLELYNLAAKCALMNAEHESFKALSGQIMHNARSFEDKYQAISNTITLLSQSGNEPEAVELMKRTLVNLGEGLPKNIEPSIIKSHLDTTKAELAVLSDDILLSYPVMLNRSKMFAVELLVELHRILASADKGAVTVIIPLKIIQISLAHGICQHSPIGYALYGNYLAFVRNEFKDGYRYVKVALSMKEKIQCRAQHGPIIYYANHTKLHVEPMQSAIELYLDGYKASMKNGHPHALELLLCYVTFCFWTGKNLNAVIVSFKEAMKEAKYQDNLIKLSTLLPIFLTAFRLMGQNGALQLEGMATFGEICNTDSISGTHTLYLHTIFFVRLFEALIFREIDEARDTMDKYFSIDSTYFSLSMPTMFLRTFYAGLASFWVGRETEGRQSEKCIARGVECKDEIKRLAFSASDWNFQNKAYLLQAEEQFCKMNFELAEQLYDLAISNSKTHKFLNEEALANELAGHFYLDTGKRSKSVHYFSQAAEKYNEWGAIAKANALVTLCE